MSKDVKIGRLRIRVPAAQAGNPKALAAEVARQLAGAAGGWRPAQADVIRAKVPAGATGATGLAGSIARSVSHSMGQRGNQS